ncbi:MAG: hypothetical protein HZB46_06425 [Solirubrobacterales bacterium]|nr:hypothetical protein [Solirubrobacterales bacterium]
MRLIKSLLLAFLLATAVAPAAAQAKVGLGIADQKADMFDDPRFTELGIKYVRKTVPWDVLKDPKARLDLDLWMAGANATGAHPLLTFDRSPRRKSYNPTPKEFATQFKKLRARYAGLREVAVWNEPNLSKKPELVAKWWLALSKACRTCVVLGADLVDHKNLDSWARRFVKTAKRTPRVWGLHNYVDANLKSTKRTRSVLKAIKGRLWLTETGGVVSRNNKSKVAFPTSPTRAAEVTSFVFNKLVKVSPRIERVYLYHWNTGAGDGKTWDSGLVGPDGPRPALDVVRRLLGLA